MFSGRRRVNAFGVITLVLKCCLFLAPSAASAAAAPTFNRDVAPIVFGSCSPCHHPGGAGPFSLLSYAEVRNHRRQIVDVTERGVMPPWPPQAGYGKFEGERHLSQKQIDTIASWVTSGAPEGSPADLPALPVFPDGWQLGKPDLVVVAGAPLSVPPGGPDLFWNFTFKPEIAKTRYVRAIDIRPGGLPDVNCPGCATETSRTVHHANALIDRTGSVARFESHPGAGFPGMELTLNRNPFDPPSHFLFWKPGNVPAFEPEGMSWRLDPGNVLVLNTHVQPSGKPQSIRPAIALYFTDRPPTRFPLLLELEDDDALNIAAGNRNFALCDRFRLPIDIDLLAIYPHAHYLGKLLEAYATVPNGKRIWLIRIPDWNLNWQAVYRYREPIFLPKGTVISMRFHYDNSQGNPRNPNRPPKTVRAGNNANDEMGHLWLQVLPRGRGDRRRELEEAVVRHRLDKSPLDFEAHLNLGAILLSRLHTQEAISALETAIKLDGKRPEPHDMLGSALRSVGRSQDAVAEYKRALAADSNYMDARYNLAITLARSGDLPDAISNFQPVIEAFPKSSRLQNEFGELLARNGELEDARARFEKAIQLEPSNQNAKANRDWVLAKLGENARQ